MHDDSLDKVREKEAAASRLTPIESNDTPVQQTASTNVLTHRMYNNQELMIIKE